MVEAYRDAPVSKKTALLPLGVVFTDVKPSDEVDNSPSTSVSTQYETYSGPTGSRESNSSLSLRTVQLGLI